MNEITLEVE